MSRPAIEQQMIKNDEGENLINFINQKGLNINERGFLHLAVRENKTNFLSHLINHPETDLNLEENYPLRGGKLTALHAAAVIPDISPETVRILLTSRRLDVNKPNRRGVSPLLAAILSENYSKVEILVPDPRVNLNVSLADRNLYALQMAMESGQVNSVQSFVTRETNPANPYLINFDDFVYTEKCTKEQKDQMHKCIMEAKKRWDEKELNNIKSKIELDISGAFFGDYGVVTNFIEDDNTERKKIKLQAAINLFGLVDENLSKTRPEISLRQNQKDPLLESHIKTVAKDLDEEETKELYNAFYKLLHQYLGHQIYDLSEGITTNFRALIFPKSLRETNAAKLAEDSAMINNEIRQIFAQEGEKLIEQYHNLSPDDTQEKLREDAQKAKAIMMAFHAASTGDKKLIATAAELGADFNYQRKDGVTAISIAAAKGHKNVVEALLEQGVNPNIPRESGATALSMAAQEGKVEIINFLLEHGANPSIGKNPIVAAITSTSIKNMKSRTDTIVAFLNGCSPDILQTLLSETIGGKDLEENQTLQRNPALLGLIVTKKKELTATPNPAPTKPESPTAKDNEIRKAEEIASGKN